MSITYICDCCKNPIKRELDRCTLQLCFPGLNKKEVKHACKECYAQYVAPAITGKFALQNLSSESSIGEDVTALNEAVTDDYISNDWDKPRVTKDSKYFTPRACRSLHREIIAGARPNVLGEKYKIPYQTIRTYANSFLDEKAPFTPQVSEEILLDAIETYGTKLINVRTLIATCTWPFNKIADETGIPVETILLYWYNLPWFVENQSLMRDIKEEVTDGEDSDN